MDLSWTAPSGCPDVSWVRARVGRYLARPLAAAADDGLGIDARVTETADGFAAELVLTSAAGVRQRHLADADCVLVADAAAFIVALAIDPTVRAQDAPLTPEERTQAQAGNGASTGEAGAGAAAGTGVGATTATEDGHGASAASDATHAAETPSSDSDAQAADDEDEHDDIPDAPLHIGAAAGLGAGAAWQPLPAVAARIAGYGALRLGDAFRLELAVGYAFERDHGVPDTDVQAAFDAIDGALVACLVGGRGRTELGVCLGMRAGIVRPDTAQLTDGNDDVAPHAEVLAGPLLLHPLGAGLALRVEAWPTVAVVRPRFRLDDERDVYQAGIVGFAASVGMEARFD